MNEKNFKKLAPIGTQGNLNSDLVANFKSSLPLLSEQQRIAEILSQIDEVIEKEEKYKEKLERLKKAVMEDLLSGKIRVNHLISEEKELQDETN